MTTKQSRTKANPLRWLWRQARGAYQRLRGDKVDRTVRPDAVIRDRFLARPYWAETASDSAAALAANEISLQRWQLNFRRDLKQSYIDQYLLAKGGRQNMTQSDWGSLGGMLRNQYQYMNRFAEEIASGRLTEGQVRVRMDMYFKSSRQANERAAIRARGMPDLPAYPGDGSTQCLTNCRCSWQVSENEDEWLAYWTLGVAEHCPDCVQRAGDWAPLRLPKR